jgi:hypothetical protein
VESGTSRSGRLLSIIEKLRKSGNLTERELLEASGGAADAEEAARLIVSVGYAGREGGGLSATPTVNANLTGKQISAVEDYILGPEEARDFRRLTSALGQGHAEEQPTEEELADIVGQARKKHDPAPEVVKKYAKDYLDVSDIAARQLAQKRGDR